MIDPRSTRAYKLEKENRELKSKLKKVSEYTKDKIVKSWKYDYGISNNSEDRLFTETVIELQIINDMVRGADKE